MDWKPLDLSPLASLYMLYTYIYLFIYKERARSTIRSQPKNFPRMSTYTPQIVSHGNPIKKCNGMVSTRPRTVKQGLPNVLTRVSHLRELWANDAKSVS